ncbi:alpha/beta fold hydrolase [Streptomyces sp. NPDC003038]|uniref:thioesterase II family protein n=1 Tax=unclassified Streptomyces TaxID=2593676 RepID=UPI0033ABD3FC
MPYLVRHASPAGPALRLVCFPHAGGSASFFRTWSRHLDPSVELVAVCYPGREGRFSEPLIPTMDELSSQITAELLAEAPVRTVLLGHSMGAAVAYETLLRLEAAGADHFTRLCVSGRRLAATATATATATAAAADVAPRTDEELIAAVTSLGGTNAEVWKDPDLCELFLPILRNDYHLIDNYRPREDAPPLRAEVITLTGDRDPRVAPQDAKQWSGVTWGPFASHVFEGDHFYLIPHAAQVARLAVARHGA